MTRYFLAPCSGEKSYKNFLSTIRHGVPYPRIEPFLAPEGKSILSKQEVIYSWANREGKKSEWEKIANGDVVIFYADKGLIMAGDVIYKEAGDELALAMWPADDNGKPWKYTFFLTNVRYFHIPWTVFKVISGYKLPAVMGFMEISEKYRKQILGNYSSFEDLFKSFSSNQIDNNSNKQERVYLNLSQTITPTLHDESTVVYEHTPPKEWVTPRRSGYVDFEESNKQKSNNGSLGEEIVLRSEKDYLKSIGRIDLVDRVRRVSLEDTYAGYDILSFDSEGKEKKIEVKSTIANKVKKFLFHISWNERNIAQGQDADNYYIYLVFNVNTSAPKIVPLKNPFKNNHLVIEPTQFRVRGQFDL